MQVELGYKVNIDGIWSEGAFPGDLAADKNALRSVTPQNFPDVIIRLISDTDVKSGVTCRHLEVTATGGQCRVLYAAHITYAIPCPQAHLSYFTSDWGSEYTPVEADVTYDIRISTQSGRSSKGCCPFFRLQSVRAGENMLGISVGWSGNWQADFKKLGEKNLVIAGLLEENFFHTIRPGETFHNIEIYDHYMAQGDSEEQSSCFRTYFKDHIRLFSDDLETLPVCFNHWWPYEDKWINEDVFFQNALKAKEVGCTNTLLDAGWFGGSETPDPNACMPWFLKRGDWDRVNLKLFPSGLEALGRRVNQEARIPFGIWCEIEAVGEKAELNQTHDHLIAKRNGQSLGYVCMGNPETAGWALDVIRRLAEEYQAKWLKFDFNLDPGYGCDCEDHGHGKGDGLWAHYIGYYHFLEEVHRRWPEVVIENCSSGGLRIDYGLMKRCHLLFLSDPDYTRHHLKCFWGVLSHIHASVCYHFSQSDTVCAHNVDWDDADRRTWINTPIRYDTPLCVLDYMTRAAMVGVPGLSQKLTELPEWAMERLAEHIAYYKKISGDYILRGEVYRLCDQLSVPPGKGESWNAYQMIADKDRSLLFVFKADNLRQSRVIRLRGLQAGRMYNLRYYDGQTSVLKTGYEMMSLGLTFHTDMKVWSEVIEISSINSLCGRKNNE